MVGLEGELISSNNKHEMTKDLPHLQKAKVSEVNFQKMVENKL